MTRVKPHRLVVGVMVVIGGVVLGAFAQDWTQRPGEPTRARVWVQNRGPAEAVPVGIVASSAPLQMKMEGVPVVTTGPQSVVQARIARQAWQYRDLRVAAGEDPTPALVRAGAEGWETTGLVFPAQGATIVIMKRPQSTGGL